MFPFKDNIKKPIDKASVVYQISCTKCSATYIGKTQRRLIRRLEEHTTDTDSAIYQHKQQTGHEMDYANPVILDRAENDNKLKIKELLHILKRKPELNKQMNKQSEFNIKTILIKAYNQQQN